MSRREVAVPVGTAVCAAATACLALTLAGMAAAQPRGAAAGPPPTPREAAPFDMTGQWVAIVNEDWRWRMVTPPPGDITSVQALNAAGRSAADAWDPATDGSCRAFGAAGLMRMPTRLRIRWADEQILSIDTDAGSQQRLLHFDATAVTGAAPSAQGASVAAWVRPAGGSGGPMSSGTGSAGGGSLEVTTTALTPGWLRRNGVPYSEQTRMTEHFDHFTAPDGTHWLVITSIIEDPVYLNGPHMTSSHFRLESDEQGWNPTQCRSDVP